MNRLAKHLRNTFLAGALAAVPLAATALVLLYVEQHARALVPINVPFAGLIVAVAAIYLLGLLVTSVIGKYLIRLLDRLLNRLPLLREIYQAWKQVSITAAGRGAIFSRVVLVNQETPHVQILGFTNGQPIDPQQTTLCVFIPNSPNPASGRVCFVRTADCRFIDLSTEEAFKMLLSGGNYIPEPLCAAAEVPPQLPETVRSLSEAHSDAHRLAESGPAGSGPSARA